MGWSQRQAKEFAERARLTAGVAWGPLLGPKMREALVASEALRIILNQHSETVRIQDAIDLYNAMCRAAGLADEIMGGGSGPDIDAPERI